MKVKLFVALALLCGTITSDYIADSNICVAAKRKSTRRNTSSNSRYTKYTGKIGNSTNSVYVDYEGNGYYYTNGNRSKHTLRGEVIGSGGAMLNLMIYEYDPSGNFIAEWEVDLGSVAIEPGKRIKSLTGYRRINGYTQVVSLY